jgi:hypothetical protein
MPVIEHVKLFLQQFGIPILTSICAAIIMKVLEKFFEGRIKGWVRVVLWSLVVVIPVGIYFVLPYIYVNDAKIQGTDRAKINPKTSAERTKKPESAEDAFVRTYVAAGPKKPGTLTIWIIVLRTEGGSAGELNEVAIKALTAKG